MPIYPTKAISYDFSDPACYPGSGSTVFDLASNVNLPIVNATYVSNGQASYFAFNGSNTLIGKNGVTGLGNTFSVSMWSQYPSSATTQMFQFSAGTYVASQGAGPQSSITNTSVDIAFNDGIGTTSYATTPNVWHLYTFTADGTTVKGYLDGALQASVAQGIGSWDNGGLYLGVPISTGGSPYPGYYFNGKIATFDVYNVALGSTDVANVYAANSYRFDNLVRSYDFSDPLCYPGSGSTVYDLSGSEIDLPIVNATYSGTGQSKYFNFTGTNQYIGKTGVTGLGSTFTINMWARQNANNTLYHSFNGGYVNNGPAMYWNDGAAGNIAPSFNSGNNKIVASGIATSEWYLTSYVLDGSTAKLYVNGSLIGSVSQAPGSSWQNGVFVLAAATDGAGNIEPAGYFVGDIATFEVYNTALGSTAVSDYYNSTSSRFITPVPPAPPVLIGSYDFSDPACWTGTGNTIYDLSGEGNNLVHNTTPYDGMPSLAGTGQSKFATFNNDTTWMWRSPFSANGSTFISTNEFSISLWHNYPTQGTFGGVSYLLMGGYNAAGQGPAIVVDNTTQEVKGVFGAEITAGGWVSGIANTVNTWHMTTLVADGTDFLIYQDGALTGSTTLAGQWGGSNLVLGRPAGNPTGPASGGFGHKYGGYIAIAEIYSGALGSTAVSDLYDLQQPRFYPAPSNLVAYYDFSDPTCYPGSGSTVFDLNNNIDLPISGATFGGTGQSKYFSFDGVNDYIGKTGVAGVGNTFTISFWAQQDASNPQVPFSCGVYNPSGRGVQFTFSASVSYDLSASFNYGLGLVNSLSTHSPNTWDLYTYTADGTTCKLYINGTLQGSDAQDGAFWDTGSFAIGANTNSSGNITTGGDSLSGKIAILEVYNSALGSTDVSEIYTLQSGRFNPSSLVNSFDFSDPACYPGTGNTVYDIVGNLQLPISGATYGGTGQSKYFQFDGVNDYIGQNGVTGLGNTFTISAWSQCSNSSAGAVFVSGTGLPASNAPAINYNDPTANSISASFNWGTGLLEEPFTQNTWQNIIYTADGTDVKLYVDGTLQGTTTQGVGTWPTGGFFIGRSVDASGNVGGSPLSGKIALIDVYSTAIGSTQVNDIYTNESARFGIAPEPYVGIAGGRQFAQGFNG